MRKAALWFLICLMTMSASSVWAQEKKPVPPPPKPAVEGPSLVVTMKFIADKMNGQGQVDYLFKESIAQPNTLRIHSRLSDVVANSAACTLSTTQLTLSNFDGLVTDENRTRSTKVTSTVSLKQVELIAVESTRDGMHLYSDEEAAQVGVTVTPPVFDLVLSASEPLFSFRKFVMVGNHPFSDGDDIASKEIDYTFRDENTANRVAKAMVHAVELCGGGNKEPF